MAGLCPINNNLHYHGGLCIKEQCEWWVKGTERVETVYEHTKDIFCIETCSHSSTDTCCKDHCSPKTVKGPGIDGGCCALKALAVEAHDIQVELREIKHDIACLLYAIARKP